MNIFLILVSHAPHQPVAKPVANPVLLIENTNSMTFDQYLLMVSANIAPRDGGDTFINSSEEDVATVGFEAGIDSMETAEKILSDRRAGERD